MMKTHGMRPTTRQSNVPFVIVFLGMAGGLTLTGCRSLPPLITRPQSPTVHRVEPSSEPRAAQLPEAMTTPPTNVPLGSAVPVSAVDDLSWPRLQDQEQAAVIHPDHRQQGSLAHVTVPSGIPSTGHSVIPAAWQRQPSPPASVASDVGAGPVAGEAVAAVRSAVEPAAPPTTLSATPDVVSPATAMPAPRRTAAEQVITLTPTVPTVTYSLTDRDDSITKPVAFSKPAGTHRQRPGQRLMTGGLGGRQFGCRGCAHGGCAHRTPGPNWFGLEPCAHGHWPADEYLCNGGDHDLPVNVKPDWTVNGLHEGDAVVHYDTLEGQVEVVPTCEVCIYAPRFAAVRQIMGVEQHEQHELTAGVEQPLRLGEQAELAQVTTVIQPLEPGRNLKVDTLNAFRERNLGVGLENANMPAVTAERFLPYEDFLIIRRGVLDNSEKARLNPWLQAAVAWSHDASLQVVLDGKLAVESSSAVPLQSVYTYDSGGKPCLRVCKVASKANARPGETVDFTIRFDNLGETEIGNVTVIDNLNTRLAYVPDSQESSLEAQFFAQENEHDSQVLRWEIKNPLPVGHGGVIRFQCRVQ
jgi:uncharacterized repeat protein (TIGR01451 family)